MVLIPPLLLVVGENRLCRLVCIILWYILFEMGISPVINICGSIFHGGCKINVFLFVGTLSRALTGVFVSTPFRVRLDIDCFVTSQSVFQFKRRGRESVSAFSAVSAPSKLAVFLVGQKLQRCILFFFLCFVVLRL